MINQVYGPKLIRRELYVLWAGLGVSYLEHLPRNTKIYLGKKEVKDGILFAKTQEWGKA